MANFRGKNTKDIESASETPVIISNTFSNFFNRGCKNACPSVTEQQLSEETFDNEIEKRT